jgi:hypothetical protein
MSDTKEVPRGKFIVLMPIICKSEKILSKQSSFTILHPIFHRALLAGLTQESDLNRGIVHLLCAITLLNLAPSQSCARQGWVQCNTHTHM